jgi:hypothetical protein
MLEHESFAVSNLTVHKLVGVVESVVACYLSGLG